MAPEPTPTQATESQAVAALIEYYHAAENAKAIYMANGRRGASDRAVTQVNMARERARITHDKLMEIAATLAQDREKGWRRRNESEMA